MSKFQLKNFFKAVYDLMLVFLQFFIISLHFFQWEFLPQKQIIQASPFSYFLGILIIIISLIIMLVSIKDLGRNLSPFPRPINNSNLVTYLSIYASSYVLCFNIYFLWRFYNKAICLLFIFINKSRINN